MIRYILDNAARVSQLLSDFTYKHEIGEDGLTATLTNPEEEITPKPGVLPFPYSTKHAMTLIYLDVMSQISLRLPRTKKTSFRRESYSVESFETSAYKAMTTNVCAKTVQQ